MSGKMYVLHVWLDDDALQEVLGTLEDLHDQYEEYEVSWDYSELVGH